MTWRDDPRVVQCRTHLRGVRGRSWKRREDLSRKDRAGDSNRTPGTSRRDGLHSPLRGDIARSMMLTDHYVDRNALESLGQRIKSGESIVYDAQQFADQIQFINTDPVFLERVQHPERFPPSILDRIGCVVLPWAVFIAIIALA